MSGYWFEGLPYAGGTPGKYWFDGLLLEGLETLATGSVATTFGAASAALAGSVEATGTAAVACLPLATAVSGGVESQGTVALACGNLTAVLTGEGALAGSIAVTFGALGTSITGESSEGTIAVTFGALNTAIAGTSTFVTGVVGGIVDAVGGTTGAVLKYSGASLPPYTLFIAGVDRSAYLRIGPGTGSGIRIHEEVGSRSTCVFQTVDVTGAYRPAVDEEVVIYESGGTRLFAGSIERTSESGFNKTAAIEVQVNCTDYGVLCDRRIARKVYTQLTGGVLAVTVAHIVDDFLAGTGITYDGIWLGASPDLGVQMFNHCTVTEAFNQIAGKYNADWRVDFYKRLHFFPVADGYESAPYSLTNTDGYWRDMRVNRTRTRFANRVFVRGPELSQTWTDNYTAFAGQQLFPLSYPVDFAPEVTVNGVEQIVVEISAAPFTVDYDFYYIDGGNMVFAREAMTGGEAVVVAYPSPMPGLVMAEDTASQAIYGVIEYVEEVKDIYDFVALQALADGLLARCLEHPVDCEFTTRLAGFHAGQLLTVNTAAPLCNETLLIESVDAQLVGKSMFWYGIRASNQQLQRPGSGTAFYTKLIERVRKPLDRITQNIRFTLAETIEGIANPGLTTGVKPAMALVERDGHLRDIRLRWDSVDNGTLTTEDITLDVRANGVTLLGPDKLVFPAGTTDDVVLWTFAANPQPVYRGDKITVNVIDADAAAKDGILEIVILG